MEFVLMSLGVCALTMGIVHSSPPIAKRRLQHTKALGLKKMDVWSPTIFSIIGFLSLTAHIILTWK